MANKMENHPLLTGLKTRLYSDDYKLDAKVNLITNLYKSNVPIPYKDELVLDWIIKNLNQKYLIKHERKSDDDEDIIKFWILLDACLQSIDSSGTKVELDKELLLNLADKVDLTLEHAANAFLLIIKNHDQEASSREMILVYASLLQKTFCAETIMNRIMNVMEVCISAKENFGVLLASLSLHCSTSNIEKLQQLLRKFVLNSPGVVDSMFINMHQYKGVDSTDNELKFDVKNVLFEYFLSRGDVNLLLKSANDPSFLQTRTKLFILFVHFSGKPLFSSVDSLIQAKVDISLNVKPDTKQILLHSLPLDLDYSHDKDPSKGEKILVNRILSEVLIDLIDKYKLNKDNYDVLEAIMNHHPNVLETLGPLIVSRSLTEDCGDYGAQIFQLIIDVELKLRQLPKFISKFQMYLRNYDGKVCLNDCCFSVVENAINQIPRGQNLEIWRTILYHLGADFFKNIEDRALSRRVWMTCLPILRAVFTSGHLVDHNLPDNFVSKLKLLIISTFTDLILKVEDAANKAVDLTASALYHNFVSDYLEFVHLLSLYKNIEFNQIGQYRTKLIESILSQKDLGGYGKLVSFTIRNHSSHELELLNMFARDLPNELVLSNIKKIEGEDKFGLISEVEQMDCEETVDGIALRLSQQFSNFHKKTGKFLALSDQNLWLSNDSEQLWDVLKQELDDFTNENISVEDLDLDLKNLPIENLPKVLKLGGTLVFFIHLLVSPTNDSCSQLGRCLPSNKFFKLINYFGFAKKILGLNFEISGYLLDNLASEFIFKDGLLKLEGQATEICDRIQEGRVNYVHFFSLFVEKFNKECLQSSTGWSQHKDLFIKFRHKLIKSFMKLEISDKYLVHQVQVAIVIINIQQQQLDHKIEKLEKADKYVKKVLTASLETGEGLQLVYNLLQAGERFKHLLTSDVLESAWKLFLEQDATDDSTKTAIKILDCLDSSQRTSFLSYDHHTYKIAMVLTALKHTDKSDDLSTLEHLVLKILEEEDVDLEDKTGLLLHICETRASAVSADVVVGAMCMLMSLQGGYCSSKTATILDIFIKNNLALCSHKYIHCMVELLRHHLKHLADADTCEAQHISLLLLKAFKELSRKKLAWTNFTHFLVPDVITASIQAKDQNVKNLLVEIMYVLLDMCEYSKREYISVSLPADANEVFKAVLKDYKTLRSNKLTERK